MEENNTGIVTIVFYNDPNSESTFDSGTYLVEHKDVLECRITENHLIVEKISKEEDGTVICHIYNLNTINSFKKKWL